MEKKIESRKTSEIVFREDLYPRLEKNHRVVQEYAEVIEVLPPIEINQHNELIDGWHRWTAHKKLEKETIDVFVTPTKSDAELLELAIIRNATWGLALSNNEKRDLARKIYHMTPNKERDEKKKHLEKILSVSDRTIRGWLSRIDKDEKDKRNKRIFDLYMACYTEQEIADIVGISQKEASRTVLDQTAELPKSLKPYAEHAVDFEVPIYNIWKQQEQSKGSKHPGNSESRWVDNLLYHYTKPFDIVVDPFAGGGSTIDICKKRYRRYWVGDRKPIVERETEIRKHDIITDGLPNLKGRWKDVRLIYLDPPYWKQSEGVYSNDPTDFGNMSLEDFNTHLSGVINGFAKKLTGGEGDGGYIALIIQPTQWRAPNRKVVDHIKDMLRLVDQRYAEEDMRYSVPYESQQCTAQMVDWAKENRKGLVLTREIVVWVVATGK